MTDDAEEDQIDKSTLEIKQSPGDVFTKMTDLSDELPDNSPRFVLLSYPLTMVSLYTSVALDGLYLIKFAGIWAPLCALRDDQLPAANLLSRDANAVRWCKRAAPESGRGEPDCGNGGGGGDREHRGEAEG